MANKGSGGSLTAADVFSQYADELRLVEESLRGIFASEAAVIPMIGEHIVRGGGKRLRPLFLLLSAELAGYQGDGRVLLSGVIEAIHTASLLHDDVVDDADVRRGKPSANKLWGNQVVILVGDYCYANALRLAVLQGELQIIEALSGAITAMTEGELLQLSRIGDPDITFEEYYKIISAKTGALISAACRIGGILGRVSPEREEALAGFGMKTGIAFQIADDLLDYRAEEAGLGKKLGKDLEEGKITLPLIYLLNSAEPEERVEICSILRKEELVPGDLDRIMLLFSKYRSLEESLEAARKLITEAREGLRCFDDRPSRDSLLALADYALEREK